MTEKYIDITNIDKDKLLEELWNNSNLILFDQKFDLTIAKSQMKNLYPDYICGRLIKSDIYNSNFVNPYLYDRENGIDSFKKIVDKVKCYTNNKNNNFNNILSEETSKLLGISDTTYQQAKSLYNDLF